MAERRRRGFRVVALPCAIAVVVAASAAAVPATEGCTTHQCDPDCVVVGMPPDPTCPGTIDGYAENNFHAYKSGDNEITWESTRIQGGFTWLDFPGQRTYKFNWIPTIQAAFPDLDVCRLSITNPIVYVALDQYGGGAITATGQLAETNYPGLQEDPRDGSLDVFNGELSVFNATCARYFLRVVVTLEILPQPVPLCHPPMAADASDGSQAMDVSTQSDVWDAATTSDGG